jgi:hypothetical protein
MTIDLKYFRKIGCFPYAGMWGISYQERLSFREQYADQSMLIHPDDIDGFIAMLKRLKESKYSKSMVRD